MPHLKKIKIKDEISYSRNNKEAEVRKWATVGKQGETSGGETRLR